MKVVKNKLAAPFRQAEFDIEFGRGISTAGCLVDLGLEHNIVSKSGSISSDGEQRLGQGRGARPRPTSTKNPSMATEIEEKDLFRAGIGKDKVTPLSRQGLFFRRPPRALSRPKVQQAA